jgi:hypothetical protein
MAYIITFPYIFSSQGEFEEPSPSQYKVERSKKQLDQQQSLGKESDDDEGDSNFPTSGKIKC